MLALAAYAERLSARPGETLRFHVSNTTGLPVSAHVVRVICADPNPAIGGVSIEPVDLAVAVLGEPAARTVPLGSWATLGPERMLAHLTGCTFEITVQPTLTMNRRQVIMSCLDPAGRGIELSLSPALTLVARVGTSAGLAVIDSGVPVPLNAWTRVRLVVDPAGRVDLSAAPLAAPGQAHSLSTQLAGSPVVDYQSRTLSLASASDTAPVDSFNGRLEDPRLAAGTVDPASDDLSVEALAPKACIGTWDFCIDMHSQRVIDIGPNAWHGRLWNTPTRAVCGSRWTGREPCFRHAPEQYAAIHFHADDLDDCRWPATHSITLPADVRSDAYALILRAGDTEENVPFFVVPSKGGARAKIAVLVSTYTYTVYGNHARPEWMNDPSWREAWIAQARDWKAYPHNPGEHRDYGLSTYNYHTDGSGIGLVSWRRPMLNLRVGYFTFPYPEIRGSGLRHFQADSHLLMWLAHKGHAFELITDHELHHEGLSLLKPYKVVITGSHPEYHTRQMLDALQTYRDAGGRLVYLGGNGFYWKIALDPVRDGIVEIRRAEGGIRAWAAEAGEYYHQFDGEYGGLWRRNARPPQKLVGVGFTAQGNFVGSWYRIKPEVRNDPRVSWVLDGVTADTVGGEGFSGHGAAGFELDRVDTRLGSPGNAVVIASSEDHPPEAPWVLVPEEQLTHITTIPGQPHKALIRADMTWFDCPGGGEVFAVGSITFCGSLPVNRFDNDVSRILDNVVRRFVQ